MSDIVIAYEKEHYPIEKPTVAYKGASGGQTGKGGKAPKGEEKKRK